MKPKLILPIAALAAGGLVFWGTAKAYAQTNGANNPVASLVQKIAQRFNLNPADVQQVFDQARSERQTQRQLALEDRLTQLVKDGKITEAQKQAIINKFNELKNNRQANIDKFKNMTPSERKSAMQQERTDLQNWATQNGIDLKIIFPGVNGMMHGRKMGWFK
jgi:hypothetical protein